MVQMNVNIMEIQGDWDVGYVLDSHTQSSTFIGYDQFGHKRYETDRTEVGEAVFQLKYRSDLTKAEPLAEALVVNLKSAFKTASLLVPMPPSKNRETQPVIELAKKVSEKMGIPCFCNILLKTGTTPQMKDIATKDKRLDALMGCFCINDEITNDGCWDALIIDDLYSSGASLSAATLTLKSYPKINKIFVAAFSRTK